MQIKVKVTNEPHRYDISRPRPTYGHRYLKYNDLLHEYKWST